MSTATPFANEDISQAQPPQGRPCTNCGSPVDGDDRFCNACGAPQPTPPPTAVPASRKLECKNCGAILTLDADQRSITCPFCDSNYVVDVPSGPSNQQPPEFVLGFAITAEQANEKFRQWIRSGGLFRPGNLDQSKIEEKLRGVYLPFWSFSMLAQSRWSANIGEHWTRVETYTTIENGKSVTRTRTVTETEWWPLAGDHHGYYSGYLVSGSRGLAQSYAEQIKPFRTEALKRYEPYFLAGWLAEDYSVEREDALAVSQQEFCRQEQRNISGFLPGDTQSSLSVETEFSDVNSDLILLPVYLLSYRYGDKLYRFLMNGQTGKMAGDKPLSSMRIGVAVGLTLLAMILIYLFYIWNRS